MDDNRRALILLVIKPPHVWEVIKQAKQIPGVELAMMLMGSWDLAVIVQSKYQDFGKLIKRIQSLPFLLQSITLMELPMPEDSEVEEPKNDEHNPNQ